ncbi:MAG: N-acetylneuraminate synthase family protein [Flavobacteriales bacterium]|nr:N-acetylneuraminate synthase family protein [Flavobacteriales bacterium]MCX7650922.1 N-acetylneuraminate synthase family protein [Flavobacteriales bacterium]MDW8432824.1 N-acetylneuraminate synthase family protein [Flavobacteriales bacterium]
MQTQKSHRIPLGNNMYLGHGEPVFIIAEIGINHNGSEELALKMVEAAHAAGANAVKFQKRTPEICTPPEQWNQVRMTPWGEMTYIEYRHRVELSFDTYKAIDRLCRNLGIIWFASCWDEPSVDFMQAFDIPLYKIASASLTDRGLLEKIKATGKPVILSTGMSTPEEIRSAVDILDSGHLALAHATSTYPCPPQELNLRVIETLRREYYPLPVGYSGHETGLATTYAAVALGACFVERHFTLDRAMWGTDQAASVEPEGFRRMVRDIRDIERALGDGIKKVYESELGPRARLRRFL